MPKQHSSSEMKLAPLARRRTREPSVVVDALSAYHLRTVGPLFYYELRLSPTSHSRGNRFKLLNKLKSFNRKLIIFSLEIFVLADGATVITKTNRRTDRS